MYYNVDKVLQIIRSYHHNKQVLKEYKKVYSSVGVAQYGIEATLPRGNTITKSTENEAINHIKATDYFTQLKADMKYLEDRWNRVTEERQAQVLKLRLEGMSAIDIGNILGCTERYVNTKLKEAAQVINKSEFR